VQHGHTDTLKKRKEATMKNIERVPVTEEVVFNSVSHLFTNVIYILSFIKIE
jgi:hypothetical protein